METMGVLRMSRMPSVMEGVILAITRVAKE